MCNPVTALLVGGTLTSAYGAVQQSQSQASALKTNAWADLNQGYENELDSRDASRVALSKQLADLSGRGVDLSGGTPLDLLRASARNQEIDALRLRAAGQNSYTAKRAQASGVLKNGLVTAGGQLLMGAAYGTRLGLLGDMGKTAAKPVPGMVAGIPDP